VAGAGPVGEKALGMKGRWSRIRRGLCVAAVVLFACVLCCVAFTGPPPPAPCEIESLLIDDTLLPEGWVEDGPPSPEGAPHSFGVERIGTSYYSFNRGGARHSVYRAFNARQAAAGYRDFQSDFKMLGSGVEWSPLTEVGYESAVADQCHLACTRNILSGWEDCMLVAQYDVYVVELSVDIVEGGMTRADLEAVLADIDRRMAACLE
jgi:hypothetical protein